MKGKVRKTLLSIFTVVMIVATNSVGFAATDSKTIAVNDEVKGWPGWKWEYDETRILGVNMTRLAPSLRDSHIFLPAY